MTDLPAPLVPVDVDLRGLSWMPYYGDRVLRSEFAARVSDAGFRAGHHLWWAAWNGEPASSLPDDDAVLARLADLGRDLKSWRKVKDEALHGFVKCSDGRLYHKALAKIALEAWDKRVKERERKRQYREGQKQGRDVPGTGTTTGQVEGHDTGQRPGHAVPGTRERRGEDRTRDDRTRERAAPDDAEFDRFWQAWPNKVGKPDARKAFNRAIKASTTDEILTGVSRYVAGKPQDRAWLNPATFLNQERWRDQPAPIGSNGNGHAGPLYVTYAEREANQWRGNLRGLIDHGNWLSQWGPKPGEPECRVPPAILAEFRDALAERGIAA